MKRRLLVGMLMITLVLMLALAACGGSSGTTTATTSPTSTTTTTIALPHPEVTRIMAADLKQKMDDGEDIVIVDIRDASSYGKEHVKDAINISTFPPGQTLIDKLKTLPEDKLIVLYCA
jgi:outer membrane lipoprotein SlyB